MNFEDVRITPTMTVFQIAALCQAHSKPDDEVYCRIEQIGGRPVAFLCHATHSEFIPMILRKQA